LDLFPCEWIPPQLLAGDKQNAQENKTIASCVVSPINY